MSAQFPKLCGEEWQDWANKLLSQHYGPTNYQKVPDNDRGDCGIEGFTLAEGHAYQAYGCEGEPLQTKERYEKHRDKLSRDIRKFIDNRQTLERIFGTVTITRWVFFVPYYDSKEIVIHASTKTSEVLSANLPYVASDFRIAVCHEEDFLVARDHLINAGTTALQVSVDPATPEQLGDFVSSNVGFATDLTNKLIKLTTLATDTQRTSFHGKVLRWHLEGQAILQALRKYPTTYEKVIKTKSHRENFLVMTTVTERSAQEILNTSIRNMHDAFKQEVRELHTFSAEAFGTRSRR